MSINSAMLAGTSGLRANSSALAAISDNIANVNTVGYKRLRNEFTALVGDNLVNTTHNAGGVMASNSSLLTEQGPTQSSSVATNLAISGQGFFAVRNSSTATSADPFLYTRAGQFGPDADGYLKNTAGYFLQGWPVSSTGVVSNSPTNLAGLQPIRVTGISGGAEATSKLTMSANLQSSLSNKPLYNATTAPTGYDPVVNSMASGKTTPDFSTPIQIYDSEGGLHTLTVSFLKTGANTWQAEVYLSSSEVNGSTTLTNGQLATGTLAFTPFGQLDTANSTLPSTVTINQNGSGTLPEWASSLGLATQNISLDIGGTNSPGGLSSFDSPSVLGTSKVDGTPFGSLSSVEVDKEGYVLAAFTNGLTRRIYQVPVATFGNADGLTPDGGGVYRQAADSGALTLRGAGVAGAGNMVSHALEASTVDLAEEFSNLIVTQRAYSASSKIITTADQMLDELISLKR